MVKRFLAKLEEGDVVNRLARGRARAGRRAGIRVGERKEAPSGRKITEAEDRGGKRLSLGSSSSRPCPSRQPRGEKRSTWVAVPVQRQDQTISKCEVHTLSKSFLPPHVKGCSCRGSVRHGNFLLGRSAEKRKPKRQAAEACLEVRHLSCAKKRTPFFSLLTRYRVGQLYTISKHSHQESDKGEGVEVVKNEPHEDPVHGPGQFTEKRVHLSSKLPSWARAVTPRIFYITEKAWNYYPYTITEYTCSFLPKFSIYIETKYEDNCGDNANIFHSDKILGDHEVMFLDIAFDEIPERYYRSPEDLRFFSSTKTGRGPLREGWREQTQPIMCSYKLVTVKFEVWGLQTRVEQFVHKVIRDILLIGHRQAFAWVDEWCDMSLEEVRAFETQMYMATNKNFGSQEL
ncbi:PREDICTED: cytoplasmic phosphatidylinositol transfer protein 1-like [Gekko japonicus]|uniref:Cytoplasmic phosphatidylinositol transfer protein 1-like n=1 Tax=Gekko japonicus TaxID=146911 RepID=A0ABM1KMF7_GEKJA|nr:PREDICTED: cytoplasmic phosphatidylinositol transfer protein 1-like [Gekko japonicus]